MLSFGSLDYLSINESNRLDSLIQSTDLDAEDYDKKRIIRGCRCPLSRVNEYFGYQVLLALGMPAPTFELKHFRGTKGNYTDIRNDSMRVKPISKGKLKVYEQAYEGNNLKYRLHSSIALGPLAELVTCDGDFQPEQHFITEDDLRFYRFNYDREEVRPLQITKETVIKRLAFAQQHLTQEQILAFAAIVEESINVNVLEKIMCNSRVQSTPEFMDLQEHIIFSKDTWTKNMLTIREVLREEYPNALVDFYQRENVREHLAESIMQKLHFHHLDPSKIKRQLIEDLRTTLYFENPSQMEMSEGLSNYILNKEQQRIEEIKEDQRDRIKKKLLNGVLKKVNMSLPTYKKYIEYLGSGRLDIRSEIVSKIEMAILEEINPENLRRTSDFVDRLAMEQIHIIKFLKESFVEESSYIDKIVISFARVANKDNRTYIIELIRNGINSFRKKNNFQFPIKDAEQYADFISVLKMYLHGFCSVIKDMEPQMEESITDNQRTRKNNRNYDSNQDTTEQTTRKTKKRRSVEPSKKIIVGTDIDTHDVANITLEKSREHLPAFKKQKMTHNVSLEAKEAESPKKSWLGDKCIMS